MQNPFAGSTNDRMFLHGVDFAQALKSGAVWYRLFGDESALASSFSRVRRVEKYQGLRVPHNKPAHRPASSS